MLGEVGVDVAQPGDHAGPDVLALDLAELEDERVADVALLDLGLADVELARLAEVVGEQLGAQAPLGASPFGGEGVKAVGGVLARAALLALPRVGLVVRPRGRVVRGHVAVLLEVSRTGTSAR